MDSVLPPDVLGFPPKFGEWRSGQESAIDFIVNLQSRFGMVSAPTGFGKSPVYIAAALLTGKRTCVITSTKGLQTQLTEDFKSLGMVDIRGMNSYRCNKAKDFGLPVDTNCAQAPCHAGVPCTLKSNGGCDYYDQYVRAANSHLVVTNYSYWMHINAFGEGLGDFDLLILDEAHDTPDEVSSFVGVTLDTTNLGDLLDDGRTPEPDSSNQRWRLWARERAEQARIKLSILEARISLFATRGTPVQPNTIHRFGRLKRIKQDLDAIAGMDGEWVIERTSHRVLRMEPVWPGPYTERVLFRGVSTVILVSATIRPKTAALLGIDPSEVEFREYPSTFPKSRRPVIHVETIKVQHNTTDEEYEIWVNRIDQIIRQRLDRKGIIHVTSYARRDVLVANSEFRSRMLWHASETTADVVAKFRASSPPMILVSPSLTTGWDFPGQSCEYQIIAKIPFPDFKSLLSKARDKTDSDWSKYVTMQTLIQTTGRGMRSPSDRCETLIVDDNVTWFVRRNSRFAPDWWLEAYQQSATIPQPPPTLEEEGVLL